MKNIQGKPLNIKNIEILIYIVIWLAVYSVPYFQNRQFDSIHWEKLSSEWIRMTSFLVIFTLNIFIFVPKFLYTKKYLFYLAVSLLSIVLIITILQFLIKVAEPIGMPPMDLGQGMPPMELGTKMQPPMGFRLPNTPEQKSVIMVFFDNFVIAILLVAASTSIKIMSQWITEEGKRKDLEKEQLKTELALLRHQVSPHFLMNTLNNIHALIEINSSAARDAVIRLSTLMRYLLYETSHGYTYLKKEIEFIESYIALMKLRFSNKVTICVDVPKEIPDIKIPPMLFISFIENAFKHGVSYQSESYVIVKMEMRKDILFCSIKNSKHNTKENTKKQYSGIGLTNISKSLALLYDNDYKLEVIDSENEFEVQLIIPVYANKMFSN